ncbi:MAG: thioredoxin [Planctomycetaceae bacterium]
MAGSVLEFTDGNFQAEVLDSQQPVLVDFWAPWCGPCKMLAPTIEQLAGEFDGKVRIGKLNTDDNPQVASSYGISAIPTVLLFKGGNIVERFVGVTPKGKMSDSLTSHL